MAGLSKTPKTEVTKVEKEIEEPGKLTLVCGPMYAGKTSHLIANYEKHKDHAIVINFCDDNRYSKTMLSSHDQLMIPCIKVRNLAEVEDMLEVVLLRMPLKPFLSTKASFTVI